MAMSKSRKARSSPRLKWAMNNMIKHYFVILVCKWLFLLLWGILAWIALPYAGADNTHKLYALLITGAISFIPIILVVKRPWWKNNVVDRMKLNLEDMSREMLIKTFIGHSVILGAIAFGLGIKTFEFFMPAYFPTYFYFPPHSYTLSYYLHDIHIMLFCGFLFGVIVWAEGYITRKVKRLFGKMKAKLFSARKKGDE